MSEQTLTASAHAPAVVVFGRDDAGKPHASSFAASEAGLAEKAAGLMGMRLLPIKSDAELALALRVPKGKVFASGKGFVPFIKAALYNELESACPVTTGEKPPVKASSTKVAKSAGAKAASATPAAEATPAAAPVRQPSNWADILVGSIVLAPLSPDKAEWYECVVLEVKGDRFTLRYADFPDQPLIKRQRVEIGLMHPIRQPEPPREPGEQAANA